MLNSNVTLEMLYNEVVELKSLLDKRPKETKELLTSKEVRELLSISNVTLHKWINEGRLISYKMHSKLYFKYSDLMAMPKQPK
jgi:excisionase family DNA binding protein